MRQTMYASGYTLLTLGVCVLGSAVATQDERCSVICLSTTSDAHLQERKIISKMTGMMVIWMIQITGCYVKGIHFPSVHCFYRTNRLEANPNAVIWILK